MDLLKRMLNMNAIVEAEFVSSEQQRLSNGKSTYPGGSRERVNRAGRSFRNRDWEIEDHVVLEQWRAAHRPVLNTFQSILRNRTRNKNIIVAQRHKRRSTILGKLDRYEKMNLSRMDDVAGCRLIFESIEQLYEFREDFHKARFNHRLRNEPDKYDYIKYPKASGYRGVHDVYSYNVNSPHGAHYKGLFIEIQYRTIYQHAWATAVEVVGFITESQPKFDEGDGRYLEIFGLASEIIARAFEDQTSSLPTMPNHRLVSRFLELDAELSFMQMLRALNAADSEISDRKNVILSFEEGEPSIRTFRDATDALITLFQMEKEAPDKDVVLVRADTSEEVRIAFRNYFSDATDFIRLIDEGCQKLLSDRVISAREVREAMMSSE